MKEYKAKKKEEKLNSKRLELRNLVGYSDCVLKILIHEDGSLVKIDEIEDVLKNTKVPPLRYRATVLNIGILSNSESSCLSEEHFNLLNFTTPNKILDYLERIILTESIYSVLYRFNLIFASQIRILLNNKKTKEAKQFLDNLFKIVDNYIEGSEEKEPITVDFDTYAFSSKTSGTEVNTFVIEYEISNYNSFKYINFKKLKNVVIHLTKTIASDEELFNKVIPLYQKMCRFLEHEKLVPLPKNSDLTTLDKLESSSLFREMFFNSLWNYTNSIDFMNILNDDRERLHDVIMTFIEDSFNNMKKQNQLVYIWKMMRDTISRNDSSKSDFLDEIMTELPEKQQSFVLLGELS